MTKETRPRIRSLETMNHNKDTLEIEYDLDHPCQYYYKYMCSNCGKYMGESSIYT
jgi:hypothetical protein